MADVQIKNFVDGFFRNLKCDISSSDDIMTVSNIPKSFEDFFGKKGPYKFSFSSQKNGTEYILRGSPILNAINNYLEGSGKMTLLRIDFEVDAFSEIKKALTLKNCEISNITRKYKNNFFSRFTFMTTFRYLNESEQMVNEIYVHDGKIVDGDLSGYKILEGERDKFFDKDLEKDYSVAREFLKVRLKKKIEDVGNLLKEKLESEVERINAHYHNQVGELGGDLNSYLKKINEVENQLKTASLEDEKILRGRLDRLQKNLVKAGNDDSKSRILKEQEFTIRDAQHKHSLNIDNKLVNTTAIYYPIFSFDLLLKSQNSRRTIELSYDPLKKLVDEIFCESCHSELNQINLCSSGHISCGECFNRCGECGVFVCEKCLKRSCNVCGKILCKSCSKMCLGCGKIICKDHLRNDCVTGDERCVTCLRACLKCHGLSASKNFGESVDGSKVCLKCLGLERRDKIIKGIFKN